MSCNLDTFAPHGATPEDDIAHYIDALRQTPDRWERLIDLLPQRHEMYVGRGANQVARIRGYVLASFQATGLGEPALKYVLEELESSMNPYLVAAAARALRGLPRPSAELAPYLLRAVSNMRYHDDAVSFDTYKPAWPLAHHTTALKELFLTLAALGAEGRSVLAELERLRSSDGISSDIRTEMDKAIEAITCNEREPQQCCCEMPTGKTRTPDTGPTGRSGLEGVRGIAFEDQDGRTATYAEIFRDKPTVLAFFYTRCENPNKCSLTVTKLGQLQKRLAERDLGGRVRIAAVTYDPGYDTPERLRGYCGNRSFAFDEDNMALRADKGRFRELSDFFELGVSYSGSVVSRHRIELYLLGSGGSVATRYENLQWDVEDVASEVQSMLTAPTSRVATPASSDPSTTPAGHSSSDATCHSGVPHT